MRDISIEATPTVLVALLPTSPKPYQDLLYQVGVRLQAFQTPWCRHYGKRLQYIGSFRKIGTDLKTLEHGVEDHPWKTKLAS
mmetsp:Transcript_13104/g.22647  ORF Transcript_13104/g.22647 Transcript_13104/m.22647 type:complete len:82 (-) Transcript_13104:364-609(-)